MNTKQKVSSEQVGQILAMISDQKKKNKVSIVGVGGRKKLVDDPDEPDIDNLWSDSD